MKSKDSIISKIALGTVQFGLNYGISNREGQTSENEVAKILDLAFESGIHTIDTAAAYGDSEKVLGRLDLREAQIISKFPPHPSKDLEAHLDETLFHLGLERIYGYLAHRVEDLFENENRVDELKRLKASGKVSKVGCSIYKPDDLMNLWEMDFYPDMIQAPYNLLDRRFDAVFGQAKERGCEIHIRSVFLQGLFFADPEKLSSFFEPVKPFLKTLENQFPDKGKRAAQLLLFCLNNPLIDKVVIGVNSADQLRKNLNALKSHEFVELQIPKVSEPILMPHLWPKAN